MEGQKFSQNLLTSRPLGPNCLKSRFSPAPPSLPLSSAALRLLTSLLPAVFPPQGRPRCLPPAPGTALPLTGPLPGLPISEGQAPLLHSLILCPSVYLGCSDYRLTKYLY